MDVLKDATIFSSCIPQPLLTRWWTVASSLQYCLARTVGIVKFCSYMADSLPSADGSQKVYIDTIFNFNFNFNFNCF
jgi:hypothetical protein